jgi:hypothetical protein
MLKQSDGKHDNPQRCGSSRRLGSYLDETFRSYLLLYQSVRREMAEESWYQSMTASAWVLHTYYGTCLYVVYDANMYVCGVATNLRVPWACGPAHIRLQPWRETQHVPPKRWYLPTGPYGVTTQTTNMDILVLIVKYEVVPAPIWVPRHEDVGWSGGTRRGGEGKTACRCREANSGRPARSQSLFNLCCVLRSGVGDVT